jgi:hypothetical protein
MAEHLYPPESVSPRSPAYSRTIHAAHDYYTGAPLHDLERWDVTLANGTSAMPIYSGIHAAHHGTAAIGVPPDAEYHSGYLDRAGRLHRIYVRRVTPASKAPDCEHCARRASR